jgi:hypothetical protein
LLITNLAALLSTTKGAAAATVVAAAALTGVAATNQDVQNAVNTTVQTITRSADSSQPAVVAARNKADKDLREAFRVDQQKLAKLHSTHVDNTDRALLNNTVNTADAALRDRLTKALNDVAALTLGRNGLEGASGATGATGATGSPDIKKEFTAETQTKIDDVVTTAVTDMDKIAKDAEDAVALLPTVTPGKPEDVGKPADVGKPTDVQGGKPASVPTPPAHP